MSRQRMPLKARVFPILVILFLIAGVRPAKAESIDIDLPSLLVGCPSPTSSTCDAGVSSVSGIFSGLNFEMSALRDGSPANLSVRLDTSGSPSEPFVGIIGPTQADELDLFTKPEMFLFKFGSPVNVDEIDINKLFRGGFAGDTHSARGEVSAFLW